MKIKRKFALVCYAFPPAGMGYAKRVGKICKYISRVSEWEPIVFCCDEITKLFGSDADLTMDLSTDLVVNRVSSFEKKYYESSFYKTYIGKMVFNLKKIFSFPDQRIDWARNMLRYVKMNYPNQLSFEVVFASGPPRSSYVAGYWLARYWNVPLIIDLRDPWNATYVNREYSPVHKMISTKWERRIYEFASEIVVNTDRNYEILLEKYPSLNNKVSVVPNGYDPDDIICERGPDLNKGSEECVNFLYLGGVRGKLPGGGYFEEPLLELVSESIRKHPELMNKIRFHFVGSDGKRMSSLLVKYNLLELFFFYGAVSSKDIGRPLSMANAFLVIVNKKAEGTGWIPSKVYDYMTQQTPILAISPECGLTNFMKKHSNCFKIIYPNSINGVNQFKMFVERVSSGYYSSCIHDVSGLSRINIAKRLARLLSSVSNNN